MAELLVSLSTLIIWGGCVLMRFSFICYNFLESRREFNLQLLCFGNVTEKLFQIYIKVHILNHLHSMEFLFHFFFCAKNFTTQISTEGGVFNILCNFVIFNFMVEWLIVCGIKTHFSNLIIKENWTLNETLICLYSLYRSLSSVLVFMPCVVVLTFLEDSSIFIDHIYWFLNWTTFFVVFFECSFFGAKLRLKLIIAV